MSTLTRHLNEIWQMEDEQKEKCIAKIKKIGGNILNNPENPKFKDMKFTAVRKAFKGMGPGLHFLFAAGFVQSVDGQRFQLRNWSDLEHAMNLLNLKENPPPEPEPAPEPEVEPEPAQPPESEQPQPMDVDENAPPTSENADVDMAPVDAGDAPPPEEQEEDPEEVEARQAALAALAEDGIEVDDDLLASIRAAKGNTVQLKMSELVGKTKEEKLAILADKREQFRKEKDVNARRDQINRERQRRENVKAAAEARRKEEDRRLKQMAERKKREKKAEKERKRRIREKIRLDKERRAREKAARQPSDNAGNAGDAPPS